ncbi:MAG: hypothetical protein OXG98_11020, partial [Gemmatimonadetes bacterium]|nr:hypothetical protein [Gemmatimonadota bacterium]
KFTVLSSVATDSFIVLQGWRWWIEIVGAAVACLHHLPRDAPARLASNAHEVDAIYRESCRASFAVDADVSRERNESGCQVDLAGPEASAGLANRPRGTCRPHDPWQSPARD